ncbi:TetR/AcrR family transcriptional regulator [Streptomyces cynarae]|uniref:TetR/AcrR family transcriptional regulator n=1 Tax=Streptomyces cynarae TaxID=2981134 RepID=UPI00406D1E80
MEANGQGRSARKHQAILEAATAVFLEKGYGGTSMDDIARLAAVSKQTVYKHFSDKETLFTEIILATTSGLDDMINLVADVSADAETLEESLIRLARGLLTAFTEPQVLKLRRLIIATAEQFPSLGSAWYEKGFERGIATLATVFQRLADHGVLRIDDALQAAHHFSGLLLWIPVNEAMFTGRCRRTEEELAHYASAGVRTFLTAYR